MQENNDKNQGKNGLSFESLDILIAKWKDGTFSEIIDDWKWIFSYSARYKWAIVFYTILGIFSTSMGLVSSVASKYVIDIITGYKTNKLMIVIIIMVGSSLFSLQKAYGKPIDRNRVTDIEEISGHGVKAKVDGVEVAAGNAKLMKQMDLPYSECHEVGTIVHVAVDGTYAGHILRLHVVIIGMLQLHRPQQSRCCQDHLDTRQ